MTFKKLFKIIGLTIASSSLPIIAISCNSSKEDNLENKVSENKESKSTTEQSNTPESNSTSEETKESNEDNLNISKKYVYDDTNDYYESADGLSGQELLNEITRIQKSHMKGIGTYNDLKKLYNTTNAFRDIYFEKDDTILDVYSENPDGEDPYNFKEYMTKNGGREGDGTNREHIIPQSWFNKESPLRNDGQFVWPTDIKVNNRRSNYPHGNVVEASYTSQNGSKLGTDSLKQTVFEPVDKFKGDIARAYLYFIATYNDKNILNRNSIFKNKFPYIDAFFLDVYRDWDKNDTVDIFDITRNNETAKFEEMRNPFIDYPNLYENIFGENPKPFHNKGVLVSIHE
ncbi:endonuclease [Mycoplasma sp. CSL7491-lung]|uniref:endonuclease n=1 Tax=Mycoplasma sp. CSL7491-lung TaxID=549718 RepID=UPI001C102545|nr:endonuclease [Mycoplasma sp. CSL7491-lung]MBU4693272.1 endonuclease [Mycoplasma sp. CSL7491-lung]